MMFKINMDENQHEHCEERVKELEEQIESQNEMITELQGALSEINSIARQF
jgi:uncharacterized coiled-coil protein SlyX